MVHLISEATVAAISQAAAGSDAPKKKSPEPWAYVAHKDGKFGGVCSTSINTKYLKEFLGGFAADGFTLQPVFNRDEYLELIKDMPAFGT